MGGGLRGQSVVGTWQHVLFCQEERAVCRLPEPHTQLGYSSWPREAARTCAAGGPWPAGCFMSLSLAFASMKPLPPRDQRWPRGPCGGQTERAPIPHLAVQVRARSLCPLRASFSSNYKMSEGTPVDFPSCSESSEVARGGSRGTHAGHPSPLPTPPVGLSALTLT